MNSVSYDHARVARVVVHRHARLRKRVAGAADQVHALHEVHRGALGRQRERAPAQLIRVNHQRRHIHIGLGLHSSEEALGNRWANLVHPCLHVSSSWSCESSAVHLLCIQTHRTLLWAILSNRKSTRNGLKRQRAISQARNESHQ